MRNRILTTIEDKQFQNKIKHFPEKIKFQGERREYHARVLSYLENTKISKETHRMALAAAGFQAGKSRF